MKQGLPLIAIFAWLALSQAARAETPSGIRPDCSETPSDFDQLMASANSPQVSSAVDFLRTIPEGTLQSFTFVYDSKSAQREGVDRTWPRVIRFSTDGKLMISYTCNPSSPTYNTVEVIRFDPATASYKFSEIDFRGASGPGSPPPAHRVTDNPSTCKSCHAPDKEHPDMRPNWAPYFVWKGAYGSNDDQLREGSQEKADYLAFRRRQKDNPCYSSLPWPKDPVPPGYEVYPYSTSYRTSDYNLRPNLKITDFQSHNMAKRIARKLNQDPRYLRLKYLMMMDAAGCGGDIDAQIRQVLPAYRAPAPVQGSLHDPRTATSRSSRLFAVSQALGFRNDDWTMRFSEPGNPAYDAGTVSDPRSGNPVTFADRETGAPLGAGSNLANATTEGGTSLGMLVQGELLRGLASDSAEIRPYLKLGRGVSSFFGQGFSCVDDEAGQIILDPGERAGLCSALAARQRNLPQEIAAHAGAASVADCPPGGQPGAGELQGLAGTAGSAANAVPGGAAPDPARVAEGRALVQQRCARCHGPGGNLPDDLLFFASEAKTQAKARLSSFRRELDSRLDSSDPNDRMPPDRSLTAAEKAALREFLRSEAR